MGLIGTMTVTWAGIERLLDELIATHQQQFTDLSKEHPRSLSSKLDYLKMMERDVERYSWGAREFFRRTRIYAKRLGNERHEIIHGVIRRKGNSVVWRSQRVIYDKADARVSHREFHNDDLVHIFKEIRDLLNYTAPRIWLLTGRDYRKSPGGQIEEVHRELLRTYPPVKIP